MKCNECEKDNQSPHAPMSPQQTSITDTLIFFFSTFYLFLVHFQKIQEGVAFILDCLIMIISPSPHQPKGYTNNIQYAKHEVDEFRFFLYSNGIEWYCVIIILLLNYNLLVADPKIYLFTHLLST